MTMAQVTGCQDGERCAGPRCADSAVGGGRAVLGTRLCLECRSRLAADLTRLPSLYRECGERHLRGAAPAWTRPPAPGRGPASLLHAGAADVRHGVLAVLSSWAGLVVQGTGTRPPRRCVPDLCAFLHERLGFVVRHPAAGEFAEETARLVEQTRRVARPEESPARGVLGPCPAPGCDGRLTARGARGRHRPAHATCDADPEHNWSGADRLAAASRAADARGGPASAQDTAHTRRAPRWLSSADVTALWGIPRGSVYRLASERNWDRRRLAGRTYYAAEDVRRALAGTGV
ncbi:hypothetical protein JJV70_00350 [Streptomyces sp. JJ66]|uniref:hypothetical protein n=1 Tax=Streptomyces sp. JJ66 TaxID=2803843 RepID=UPI001C568BA4|nr:hypothetical protein [Streptomyces sp. JJ66]MBW1600577.1 hypothetical protein [Streptomyces sp. JJ66]